MMGAISGMLGLAGGAGGTGIAGPQAAAVTSPFSNQQAQDQYGQSQGAIQQQQSFLNAVNAQNGLGNQSNVFNQLQGVANGTGPNPAQAMLAQQTGANTANQAALMAGQRGTGANAGLLARQAAMQGGANQQNAVGQGATMQANQSLNALGQMGNIAGQQAAQQAAATGAYTGATQGQMGQVLGSIQGVNNANVQNQASINSANSGMAQATKGQQGAMIGNVMGGIGSVMGLAQGGMIPHYDAGGSVYQPTDPNADPFQAQAPPQAPMTPVAPSQPGIKQAAQAGPKSKIGQHFANMSSTGTEGASVGGNALGKAIGAGIKGIGNLFSSPDQPQTQQLPSQVTAQADPYSQEREQYQANNFVPADPNQPDIMANGIPGQQVMQAPMDTPQPDMQMGGPMAAQGGKVPAMVSPGERYLSPSEVQKVEQGKESPMSAGEKIPGKAKVKGAKNDYANDTVPKTLEEGGIVLPRSVTQSKNPHWAAHKFVSDLMAKQGKSLPKKVK